MNARRLKELKALIIRGLFIGVLTNMDSTTKAAQGDMFHLDINRITKEADIILTGRLVPVPVSIEQMKYLRKVYSIVPNRIFKGQFTTNSLLDVKLRGLSTAEASVVRIEENVLYMLCLKRLDLSSTDIPDDLVIYRLVGNWQGIIALDKTARERRAVVSIEKQFGVKIDDMPEAFVEAIKASFVEHDAVAEETNSPVELSDEAAAIFDALKLQVHQKNLAPSQANDGCQSIHTP